MGEFALDISAFVQKAEGNVTQVVQKVSGHLLASVVLRTPVGNPSLWKSKPPKGYVGGRLRGNWNVSIGAGDFGTTPVRDQSGGATIARGTNILHGWKDGDIYLMNSLPYVRPIEYLGHSKQAPAGMVRLTVTEFQTFVEQAVNEVDK
ncbi:Phage protein [Lysobacter dokdonensis DS-58]|uniref:Phage protein n=1 Tax=Lysobacter dokdonensis DS-58 TaxID=1300345 RepID=A0A0A2WIB4_9GAMM|nr:hypothetical protein [Lysobacter dokdonensis]KGQ19931.1 Phage protein [Lysobacter dokdonensis DS-58]